MKQTLQLKVSQQLTLTPQLQQAIKLLQLSTLELHTEMERFLLNNPLLERNDSEDDETSTLHTPHTDEHSAETSSTASDHNDNDQTTDTSSHAGELLDWGSGSYRGDGDQELDPVFNVPCPINLRDYLLSQLGEVTLATRDHAIMQILIEELSDDGYFRQDLDEMASHLPLELAIEADELMIGLRLLQQFDPPGVGARCLQEALCLQLQRLPAPQLGRNLALNIVQHHLEWLGNRDYNKLKRQLNINDDELRVAQQLIASLNPRPSASFSYGETQYLIPDVSVHKHKGRWITELNKQAVPRLRVNQLYEQMLTEQRGGSEMSSQLQEARWLVKNIQQRFDTILKVAEAIVDKQQSFFEHGDIAMRPLILRDIAESLGLHESTVSRVTTQKYLLCSRGLFELKYFFGSALDTDSGGECSATAIKAHIRHLIDKESGGKPLSDSMIATTLTKQGIQVARRTIAKYREAMQIPPASLRKQL
ncbi:RNA polymerase factor sigma-54 [Neisseriaceae bacterium TC5R-5]|nr:RNA polymerase factor sigma-54 [Neisseriaceae bacterium TC5R-5]